MVGFHILRLLPVVLNAATESKQQIESLTVSNYNITDASVTTPVCSTDR